MLSKKPTIPHVQHIRSRIGATLQERMRCLGHNDQVAADEIGCSRMTVRNIMSQQHSLKDQLLVRVAAYCNVTVEYLLRLSDKKEKLYSDS